MMDTSVPPLSIIVQAIGKSIGMHVCSHALFGAQYPRLSHKLAATELAFCDKPERQQSRQTRDESFACCNFICPCRSFETGSRASQGRIGLSGGVGMESIGSQDETKSVQPGSSQSLMGVRCGDNTAGEEMQAEVATLERASTTRRVNEHAQGQAAVTVSASATALKAWLFRGPGDRLFQAF
ncbi:hypothetical protein Aperf_G00000026929 [Anoplocephala perfoliata]